MKQQKRNVKQQNTYQIIVLCIIGLIFNWIGKWFAQITHAPFWLDAVGTCMVAYIFGPWAGMFCGIMTNLVYGIWDKIAIVYALTSAIIGIMIGYYARRGYYKDAFSTVTSSLSVGIASVAVSAPLNLLFWEGRSGNVWGDGLFDMLRDNHVPRTVCAVLGEAFIDIPDKIVTLFLMYILILIYNKRYKGIDHKVGKKSPKHGAFILGLVVALAAVTLQRPVLADEIDMSDYVKIVYDSNNKMSSSEANAICQTPDGYIWVGSYAGLYRYDGTHFKMMGVENSITNVTDLYVDLQGRLMIGTNDSGLAIFEEGEFSVFGVDEGLAANSVRCIAERENGDFYIGTTGNMSVFHADNSCADISELDQLTYVVKLTDEKDGTMVGVTNEGNCFLLIDGQLTDQKKVEDDNTYYTCVFRMENGNYLLGTNSSIVEEVTCQKGKLVTVKTMEVAGLSTIHELGMDNSQTVWICADEGFGYIKNDKVQIVNYKPFRSSIEGMIQDYEGNYWFASSRLGILELTKNSFIDLYSRVGLDEEVVNSVCQFKGLLYVGTDSGLTIIDENRRKKIENELTENLKGTRIRCIKTDQEGNLWMATYGADAIICVNPKGEIVELDPEINLPVGGRARSTLQMEDGTIVVAKSTGLVFLRDKKVVKTITQEDGLKNPQILSLCETEDHALLAGSDGEGVFVVRDGEIEDQITYENGLSSQIIMRIMPYQGGYFLVTSNAICFMDRKYNVRVISNFPYTNNLDIQIMEDGNAWVLTSAGIFIVSSDALYHNVEKMSYKLLGPQQGLASSITANAWNCISEDGWLYLSCAGGVSKIDIDRLQQFEGEYLLGVNQVSAESGVLKKDHNGIYQLDALDKRVVLEPVVLDFTLTNPCVRYYMEDFDEQQMVVRQDELSQIVYTNLPSGEYTFHFDVLDEQTMQPIKGITILMNKEMQFYEHIWFLAYLIFVILFVVIYITWMLTRIRNMSLIKEQYIQIRQAKDEAERANQTKSMFLANMSHEIRTPMTAVIGMTQMALKEEISETVREDLGNILNASQKLLNVINDILDFSKIESGKMDIVMGEYSMSALVKDVTQMIQFRLEDKPITLIVKDQPDMPDLLIGDELRLRQIMINLLNNAVKYTTEGTITFRISFLKDKSELCFEVEDTGCGIRKADLERLFESFERVETDGLHAVEGTGLGLSISKNLLELMKGKIEVESEFGKGTIFRVFVPQEVSQSSITYEKAKEKSARENVIQSLSQKIIFKGARLLIVDDNEMNLKVAKGLLKEYQMQIDFATSGWQCMDMVKQNAYDLIFLDHVMPQIDGIETLHRMQSEEAFMTPTVALTANAINGARESYIKEGFADYLSKPMEQKEVEAVLVKFLGQYMSQVDTSEKEKAAADKLIVKQEKKIEKIQQLAAQNTGKEKSPFITQLLAEGINTEAGLRYMGGMEEQYIEILKLFISESQDKMKKLDAFYMEENMQEYGIFVHAIKSNARSIGADHVADLAYQLEKAAKDEKLEVVKQNHANFVKEWKLLLAGLKYIPQLMDLDELMTKQGQKAPVRNDQSVTDINKEHSDASKAVDQEVISNEILEKIAKVAELLDDFETEAAKEYMESIEKEGASQSVKQCMLQAKTAVSNFEYDEAIEILRGFMQEHTK